MEAERRSIDDFAHDLARIAAAAPPRVAALAA